MIEVVWSIGIFIIGDQIGGFIASAIRFVLFSVVLLRRNSVWFVEMLSSGFGLYSESVVLMSRVQVLRVLVILARRGCSHENKIINAINAII